MDITRKSMDALFKTYVMLFAAGFNMARSEYKKYAMVVPSTTSANVYPFLLKFGGMREWLGDRQIKNLEAKKMTIKNRKFEDGVAVDADDIADDQYGIYSPMLQQLGFAGENLWGELAAEALIAGFTSTWLDDATFFNATRKYGSNTVNNKGTAALTATSYKAARTAMMSYKGHNGKAVAVNPNLLIVGPSLEETAFELVESKLRVKDSVAKVAAAATDNPWNATAGVIVLPELTGSAANYWYLTDASQPMKGVAVQQRQKAKLTRMDKDENENVFMRDEYVYGTKARGEAFLTLPHLIYGSDGSV